MISQVVSRLIEERDAGNISAAARRCDVSYPTMHDLASGKNPNPKRETLEKVARGYRIEVGELLGGEDTPPPPVEERPSTLSVDEHLSRIERRDLHPILAILERESLAAAIRAQEASAAYLRVRTVAELVSQGAGSGPLVRWEPGEAAAILHDFLQPGQQARAEEERIRRAG